MYKTLLTYCSFTLASLVVIVTFITATTYAQLGVAIIIYPIIAWLVFKTFLAKGTHSKKLIIALKPSMKLTEKVEVAEGEAMGISDSEKRAFLKLIGATSLSLFLFSIFNKRAKSLFFKSIPGPEMVSPESKADSKIDQTVSRATDGYRISEIDDSLIAFYGFTNKNGDWFIMKQDTDSFRYARGNGNLPENWARRDKLTYEDFDKIF